MSPGRRLAVLLAAAALVTGCTADTETPETPDQPGQAVSSVTPTDADVDLSALPVPRADLCPALDEDDVARALGSEVADTAHYRNGEEFEIRPGQVDVSHEYGCVYEAADGTTARVWVFARPVPVPEARTLVRQARRVRDCTFPESVGFGDPGVTSVCERRAAAGDEGGTSVRARLQGLFGDTWLSCEITEPAGPRAGDDDSGADLATRADRWCADVVRTIGAAEG